MTLQQLIYFNAIARLKSYTQAANELFVSQPNLSHAISKLEESWASLRLSKRGVRLSSLRRRRFFRFMSSAS